MSLKRRSSLVLFMHRLVPVVTVLLAVFSIFVLNLRSTPVVHAATNSTINFQARLQSASGAIVADGNYNIEFKLYGASSGGAALWTEDHYNNASNGLRTVNGYFSTKLGSVTAFPSSINWDQELWLTMNVGGTTTGTPSLDGEMDPRLKLTAVPYALSAGQLQTTSGSYTNKLSIQAPTGGSQVFQIQDQGAAGTYNILTAPNGSDGYIKLQASSPGTAQTGNLNITGTGIANTLQAASFDTPSGTTTLNIGSTNATAINLNQNVTIAAGKTISLSNATAGNTVISIQSTGDSVPRFTIAADGSQKWGGGSGATDVTLSRNGINGLVLSNNLQTTGLSVSNSVTLPTGIKFFVQPNNGTTIGGVIRGNASQGPSLFELQDSNSNVNASFNAAGSTLTLGRIAASGTVTQGKIVLSDGTTDNYGVTLQSTTLTGNRTISLPNESGTLLTDASGVKLQGSTPGTAQTGSFNISGTGIASALQADSLDRTSSGTLTVGGTNATTLTLDNTGSGASTVNVGSVGSGAKTVNIGTTNSSSATTISGGSGSSALNLQVANSGTINVGGPGGLATINIGGYSYNSTNIGAVGSTAASTTVQIGTSSNSSNQQTVIIGSTANTSSYTTINGTAVTLNGGTGSSAVKIQAGSGGTITVGDTSVAQNIVIGSTVGAGSVSINSGNGGTTVNGGFNVASGSTFTNASSTLNTAISISDTLTGNIGASAAATVDVATTININQTSVGQTLTLRSPTVTTAGRVVYVSNVGTASFKIGSVIVSTGTTAIFMWNGSAWTSAGIDGTGANYIQNSTSVQSANAYIQAATSGSVGAKIQANASGSGDILDLLNGSGGTVMSVGSTGDTLFKAASSTTAFQIQDASGNAMFTFNSSTGTITLGYGGNTVNFTTAGGLVAAGTAMHGRSMTFTPEYVGAVLDAASDSACSSANNGTLTSAYDGTNYRNYYNWTSSQATNQCYDVVLDVTLPNDFSSWNASDPINLQALASNTSNAGYAIAVRNVTGAAWDGNYGSSYANPGTISTSWSDVATSGFSGTYNAGDRLNIKIRMTAKNSANLQLGNLTLNYNSKW